MGFVTWFALALCLFGVENTKAQGPVVKTMNGDVMGSYELYKQQPYEAYVGIPFALPPIGRLRWQKPEPALPWEGVLDATKYSIHCLQGITPLYGFIGMGTVDGEDCLYMNVWVPHGVEANIGRKLPVMFWIYGGGFTIGTGEMYPGWGLAVDGDVIVVNYNYRLDVFGFFSTGDEAAPGNYGAWDTQLALKWVIDNIAQFNGDPNQITIFGQSAGGCMVSLCVLSPEINNLFQQAIAISGDMCISQQPAWTAVTLADIFNCGVVENMQDIVDCLIVIDADVLLLGSSLGNVNESTEYAALRFVPAIDDELIIMDPDDMWALGYGSHIKFITGHTIHDSAAMTLGPTMVLGWDPIDAININSASTNESMINNIYASLRPYTNQDELFNAIWNMYPEINTEDNLTRIIEYTIMRTDWSFGAESNWEAAIHTNYPNAEPSYAYLFEHSQSFLTGYPDWVNGSHLDDLYSVFGEPFMDAFRTIYLRTPWDATDYAISREIMDYYSNFAYTGNPNTGRMQVDVRWEPFDPARNNYLRQAPTFTEETISANLKAKYDFWTTTFTAMVKYPPEPTFPVDGGEGPLPSGKNFFDPNRKRFTFDDVFYGYEQYKNRMHLMHESLGGQKNEWVELEKTLDERFERGIASRWK